MKHKHITSEFKDILDLLMLKNTIISLDKFAPFNDEPPFTSYSCSFRQNLNSTIPTAAVENSFGISVKSNQLALIRCLSECIEQLCLFANYDSSKITHSSYQKLKKLSLNPSLFNDKNGIENKQFGWITGVDFIRKKCAYIPAQLVYFKYKRSFDEAKVNQPRLITGTAADFTHESALLHGIYEVVERDAFMTSYLNKIACPEVDLRKIKDKRIELVVKKCHRYNLELRSFITTTDLGIPSFLTLLIDNTQKGPPFSCGIKAGFNEIDSLLGSIEESLLVRTGKKRDLSVFVDLPKMHLSKIKTISENYVFWSQYGSLKYLDFILNQRSKRVDLKNFNGNKNEELLKVERIFKKNKKEIYYVDIALPEFKKLGIYTYKVIIPQLQPLYKELKNGVLRKKRLEEVALFHGIKQNQINKVPHPFF